MNVCLQDVLSERAFKTFLVKVCSNSSLLCDEPVGDLFLVGLEKVRFFVNILKEHADQM